MYVVESAEKELLRKLWLAMAKAWYLGNEVEERLPQEAFEFGLRFLYRSKTLAFDGIQYRLTGRGYDRLREIVQRTPAPRLAWKHLDELRLKMLAGMLERGSLVRRQKIQRV